ncbi:MAG: ribonuclease R [Fimbriiglobus sp.]
MSDMSARILETLSRPSYSPVKPKVLAKRMSITSDDEYAEFRKALKALVRDGRVEVGGNSTIRVVDQYGTVIGLFRRTNSGQCFVRPLNPTSTTGPDIRIREGHTLDASSGDEVAVKITRKESRGGTSSGQVVRITQRATRTFVGTYFEREGQAYVKVDGTLFAHSILVGDPGAKGAKPQDKVVIEMLRFPTGEESRGEGVISEVLGPLSQPGVDLLSVIRAFGLPEEFPPAVLDDARAQADAFREDDFQGRTDFTQDCVITIDPIDARDFDDAVSVTVDPDTKNWILTVHIADVGHFAKPGSALDSEARLRATSVYLPRKVIPMFPEVISNGLASLQEGRVRYVKSVQIEYTPGLQKADVRFFNGVIKTRKRFSYEEVSEILESGVKPVSLDEDVYKLLKRMKDLSVRLRKKRQARGSLELSMPEAVLEYDDDGRVNGAHFAINDISHQMIEDCMLAANEAVAEHFAHQEIKFLRRVHPAPREEKLVEFATFAEILGYPMKRATDRFEIQRILKETASKPERAAIHFSMLRSLKQATYSPIQDEHYALASQHYCHFTSPIRRYPDLVVHRQLDRWIRTGRAAGSEDELKILGDHCSKMERRAEQAERELVKLKILQYLSKQLGLTLDAVITGVAEYGFFAQAEQFPAEGLVHISSLTDDYYNFDDASHSLTGERYKRRFRLGDRVRVQVARIDIPKRMLDFRLTVEQPAKKPKRK